MTADDAHIALQGVRADFGEREVFRDVTCRVPRGKITVVLGGSGSGKTTLLRLIAGLIPATEGRIFVDGTDITVLSERELRRIRSKLGMMFQHGALLDSMTVFENLAFPLREQSKRPRAQVADEVHGCLASVGLTDADELLPNQLSGGMIKRVALARALVLQPVILLCDEPFSGLDPVTTRRIEALLTAFNKEHGKTIVAISHDTEVTLRMADHLIVMLPDGYVEGSPDELLKSADPRVASLLGVGVAEGDVEAETLR